MMTNIFEYKICTKMFLKKHFAEGAYKFDTGSPPPPPPHTPYFHDNS